MGSSDWNKGWCGWQDGPDHPNTKLNLTTNVNLYVLDGRRPTQSKTTCPPIKTNHPSEQINPADTIFVESSASGIYLSSTAPVHKLNTADPQSRVDTASGELAYSSASSQLALPQIPSYFPKSDHVIPAFSHSLMFLGRICDTECSVHFHKCTVTDLWPTGAPLPPRVARQKRCQATPPMQRKLERHSLSSPTQESSPMTCRPSLLMNYPVWNPLYDTSMMMMGSQSSQMSGWHKGWKFCLLAWPDISKCSQVLPFFSWNNQRSHDTNTP